MFNSPYNSELPSAIIQYLEFCFELPAVDPHVDRVYDEIARLLGSDELAERLRYWGF